MVYKTISVAHRLVPVAFRALLGSSMILSNCTFNNQDQSKIHKDASGSVYETSVLLYKPPKSVSEQPRRLHKLLGPLYVQPDYSMTQQDYSIPPALCSLFHTIPTTSTVFLNSSETVSEPPVPFCKPPVQLHETTRASKSDLYTTRNTMGHQG